MIRVRIQYRDMTEKQCKKLWLDYPEESSTGYEYTDHDILDFVWAHWNAGSGEECDLFKKSKVRSMMVGDYVSILRPTVASVWHECLAVGWRINVPWEEVLGNAPKENFDDVSHEDVAKALLKQLDLPKDTEVSFSE